MNSLRQYGNAPFSVAVIHGGPGAPGYMAPVARELSIDMGVLEPLQTAASVEGQIEELHALLEQHGDPPITLIGSSWGAMLGYLVAARYPALVKKLIMVGSGVFEARFAARITETRLGRLSDEERREAQSLMETLASPSNHGSSEAFERLGELFESADAYDPLHLKSELLECQQNIYQRVWGEVEQLRSSGELLSLGRQIRCPVLAIHGDYDPHPADGVREPLSRVLADFRFVLLDRCGHQPWIEQHARDNFYRILRQDLHY